jgi:hypothetical protein
MQKRVYIALAVVLVMLAGMMGWQVAARLMHDDAKPIGTLSRSDVRDIRAVVTRSRAPGWRWFTRANLRRWPAFVVMRLTFRNVDIREDYSWGIVTIHSDGTREVRHQVVVRFKAHGWSDDCRVEWKDGRWKMAPVTIAPANRLIDSAEKPPATF